MKEVCALCSLSWNHRAEFLWGSGRAYYQGHSKSKDKCRNKTLIWMWMLWTGLCSCPSLPSPWNSCVEALTSMWWNLEITSLDEVMRVRPPWWNCCHYKKRKRPELSLWHVGKVTVCKLRRVFSPDTGSVSPLIWDFQPPQLREINTHCLVHPVYGILL